MAGLALSVCLMLVTAGVSLARVEIVEAYPGSGDALDRHSGQVLLPFGVSIGTLSAAQGDTEATSSGLTTQPAGQAEPDPEVLQRNAGSGNAPTWFLIVLALLIVVVILVTRRVRR
jgi:hypothetical protein